MFLISYANLAIFHVTCCLKKRTYQTKRKKENNEENDKSQEGVVCKEWVGRTNFNERKIGEVGRRSVSRPCYS